MIQWFSQNTLKKPNARSKEEGQYKFLGGQPNETEKVLLDGGKILIEWNSQISLGKD